MTTEDKVDDLLQEMQSFERSIDETITRIMEIVEQREREAFSAGRLIYNGTDGTNSWEYETFEDYSRSKERSEK